MSSPLDRFLPAFDVRERFELAIKAGPELVMRTAYAIDLQSLGPIRAIIRLRKLLLGGAPEAAPRRPIGLVAEMRQLGWGTLSEEPGRLLVCGALCRPWLGDVRFQALPAAEFASASPPDQVKIAWSLEADPTTSQGTRFVHEVRAAGTDEEARRQFRRYWRWARFGIVAIRLLLLPAIRRRAEAKASGPS